MTFRVAPDQPVHQFHGSGVRLLLKPAQYPARCPLERVHSGSLCAMATGHPCVCRTYFTLSPQVKLLPFRVFARSLRFWSLIDITVGLSAGSRIMVDLARDEGSTLGLPSKLIQPK